MVEVATFRSAWNDPDALFVAVKAGFNQVNHGHLDAGTFVIDALGVRWASDLGAEDYNLPGYWNSGPDGKRWSYYRLTSSAHNVPVLDGKNQDVKAQTKITKFKAGDPDAFALLDLTSAYKDFAKKVTRGVAMVAGRTSVVVQDEFELEKPCEIAWGITTEADIVFDEAGQAIMTINGKKMTAQILSPLWAVFSVESAEQKPPMKPNKGVKRLMIRLKDQKGKVRIKVMFTPEQPNPAKSSDTRLMNKPLAEW
jgi:hypothetical protein